MLMCGAVLADPPPGFIVVTVNGSAPLNVVAAGFLSFNIDTASVASNFDFANAKLRTLIAQLGPAVLRVGGTAADYTFYLPDAPRGGDGLGNVTLSNAMWDSIVGLSIAANHTLLWNLNGMRFRNSSTGVFDPSGNATALFAYTQARWPGVKLLWSSGNEVNFWKHDPPGSHTMAKGVLALRAALDNYTVGTDIYGPSYAEFDPYTRTFLNESRSALSGFTAHHYPMRHECSVSAFLSRKAIDEMAGSLRQAASDRRQINSSALLVLEEIGGAYGGGCEGITDRYVSGYWYLHALGVVAEGGWHRMHRQDVAGWSGVGWSSHYQLLGPAGWTNGSAALTPHPDYFSSVLHGMLVGRVVLAASAVAQPPSSAANATFVHAWCGAAAGARRGGGLGGLVLVFGNPTAAPVELVLGGGGGAVARVEFVLESSAPGAPPSIQGDEAYLNGALLTVDAATGALPAWPILGLAVPAGGPPLLLPPYSYGFVAYPSLVPPACDAVPQE